jgi:hypothetical protein
MSLLPDVVHRRQEVEQLRLPGTVQRFQPKVVAKRAGLSVLSFFSEIGRCLIVAGWVVGILVSVAYRDWISVAGLTVFPLAVRESWRRHNRASAHEGGEP